MNLSTVVLNVQNLLFCTSIGYICIGVFLAGFTRVRTQLLADTRDEKDINGASAPSYKIFLLRAIITALAILLWPFFLSSWFSRGRKLYDIIIKDLPRGDVPLPTAEQTQERMAQYEKANAVITITDAVFPFPTSFNFAIGGFHGSAHELRLVHDGELEYKFAANEYEWELPVILKPDRAHWEQFWREIDAVNFWQWQPEYRTSCCDGTHWSMSAGVSDRSKRSEGSNGFPGSDGSNYPRGGQFDSFLKAVQKLAGRQDIH